MDYPAQRRQRRLGRALSRIRRRQSELALADVHAPARRSGAVDDHRDDATVWAWFETESPLSAKGKFSLARAMIARGDRANAERLVRDAWRNDFHVGGIPRAPRSICSGRC